MASRRAQLWSLVVFALVVLLVVVWFFVAGGPWPFGNAKIYGAEVRAEASVTLFVGGCEGSPQVAAVEETDDQVRVSVSATQYLAHGSDCLEVVELDLARPLGNRSIFDLATGQTVEDIARLD